LDVLRYKPGAFANSLPLPQTKARGQWPGVYQSYWERLQDRHGRTEGTLMIIEILLLHRLYSDQEVTDAVTSALHIGLNSVESIKLLIREHRGEPCRHDPLADHEHLKCYDKPTSPITVYDGLLHLN